MANYNIELNRWNGLAYDQLLPRNNISGSGEPTTSTVGVLGQIYMDTSTDPATSYQCVKVDSGVYTWAKSKADNAVTGTYPVATGQSITAGDVVDVVDGRVTTRKAQVGGFAIGTIIKLNENGNPVDYIIVHQGLPSSLYDASCNGTWVLRKDIFENRQWNSSNVDDWANSTLKAYLDSTFLARYDANIQVAIKQVKIPYRPGPGTSTTVNSGANGLPCKVFLLSGYEMGWTNSDHQYFPADGAKLSYFDSGTGTTANNKRIGYFNGRATYWWLRSPYTGDSGNAWGVLSGGGYGGNYCSSSCGVRPTFVLDSNSMVSPTAVEPSQAIALTSATSGQSCEIIYSGVAALSGVTVGQKITSDGVYGVGVLAGVLQVWSKDRPGQIVTGSFTTSSQVTTIDLGFTPTLVVIYGAKNNGKIADGEDTTATVAQIPKVLTAQHKDTSFGQIVQNGFSHWVLSSPQTLFYLAI